MAKEATHAGSILASKYCDIHFAKKGLKPIDTIMMQPFVWISFLFVHYFCSNPQVAGQNCFERLQVNTFSISPLAISDRSPVFLRAYTFFLIPNFRFTQIYSHSLAGPTADNINAEVWFHLLES